jgi:malate synthase
MNAAAASPSAKLRPEDLFSLEQYAKQRAAFRPKVIAHKRNRTLQCGPNATWLFEDRLTVQYQVQEMLRIERIFEAEGIADELGAYNPLIPDGSNWKATLLIEVILAAFEMDEILWELRDYIVGLNCGRWDYIFSFIKKFSRYPDFVLPDRSQVTMTTHFLRSYSKLLIKTTHRRGAFAMGGMAAQIPIKNDPAANDAAIAKVRADKEREAGDGHDGTWVAHPGLVPVAMEIFDRLMPTPNQLHRMLDDVDVKAADLLAIPEGTITEAGLRNNVDVSIQYMAAWLGGNGCVPIHNLMEDAATAEIARAQVWQWIRHPKGLLDDGRKVTVELFRQITREELARLRSQLGEAGFAAGNFERAARIIDEITTAESFETFLTLPAYRAID